MNALTTFNLADIWEAVAPLVADRTAVVCGDVRRTLRRSYLAKPAPAGWPTG